MYKPKKMILTAGPSISKLEEEYVLDAVRNGWNFHFRDYLTKFEQEFAKYIGVKYAWATSSGTGALHVAMLACGIGEGDEVIIPELTFVASANVVCYVGAKPIFVDIEEDTWCIDPVSFKKAITKRTKVVMPVHIYGHPANMDEINKIAKEHGLYVIEDACPSVGAEYKGKKTGSFGDINAFSFQGAKIMVTGEGGMVVTNNEKLYEKAKYFGNHAYDNKKAFWHNEVGYMYRMANLLGALGLAQLERVEEFIAKKRKIFQWYKTRLNHIDGISLNIEKEWARNIFWMSSIVLKKDFDITRDEIMTRLKENLVDTRKFFYPLSMSPFYKSKAKNPVAYKIQLNGINLPSGVNLSEEEVDYVAKTVRKILRV